MSGTLHVFDLLDRPADVKPRGICPIFGNERFLKKLAAKTIVENLSDDDSNYSSVQLDGSASWSDVNDELSTRSLFGGGGPQIVVVDHADPFVKAYRDQLEKLEKSPPSNGVLILIVDTWTASTKLYKRIAKSGTQINCSPPTKSARSKQRDDAAVMKWLVARAKSNFDFELPQAGASILIELTDCNFGRMEQELAKLSLYAVDEKLEPLKIREIVGGWPVQTMWSAIDAATDGNAKGALELIDQLIRSGEHPLALFGQMSWSLRRFAEVGEIVTRDKRNGRRIDMNSALKQAGFRQWGGELESAGRRLKQLGRERVAQMSDWILKTDLALKRTHTKENRGRLALEKLFVQMAVELGPQATGAR